MRAARLIVAATVLLGVAGCGNGADNGPAWWVDATTPTGVHIIATEDGGLIEGMALDEDAALLARAAHGALTVTRVSLKNGAASSVLRVKDARLSVLSMHGSASIVGLTVTDADDEEGGYRSGLYIGRPTGPLRLRIPIRDAGWIPRSVLADGDRLYVLQVRGEAERVVAFDVTGRSRLTSVRGPIVAGGLEARTEDLSACHGTSRRSARACVTVRRVGGGRVTAAPIGRGEASDISPSGSVIVRESLGGAVEVQRAQGLRRLLPNDQLSDTLAFYAGERVLLTRVERAFGPEQMLLAAPGRRPRRFGVRAEEMGPVRADARRVLWVANGCVLVADVRAPAATAPPEGPCLRTQIAVRTEEDPDRLRLRSDDRVPVRLECIHAPPPGCRGTMRLKGRPGFSKPRNFVVAPNRTVRLAIRLPARAVRVIRAAPNPAHYEVHVVSRDPDGRTATWEGALAVIG